MESTIATIVGGDAGGCGSRPDPESSPEAHSSGGDRGGNGGDGGEGSKATAAATRSREDSIEDGEEEAEEEEVHTCHWWGGALSWLLLLEHTGRATPQLRTDIGVDLRHDNFAALARAMEHPCQVLFDRPSTAVERVALRRGASGGGGGGGGSNADPLVHPLARAALDPGSLKHAREMAMHVIARTAQVLPALLRQWWMTLGRARSGAMSKFVVGHLSESLLAAELREMENRTATDAMGWSADEMRVVGSVTGRQVTATYMKDDCHIDIVLRLPPSYPLRIVEVECTKRLGVSEERWRRWALQIVSMLSKQDGSILEAVALWKNNVDREFDGVEACPICYSTLHPVNHSLPRIDCKTCANKFHSACLYKWFNSSHKSTCPMCRSAF